MTLIEIRMHLAFLDTSVIVHEVCSPKCHYIQQCFIGGIQDIVQTIFITAARKNSFFLMLLSLSIASLRRANFVSKGGQ